jgi:single-strand DNA-binding protein
MAGSYNRIILVGNLTRDPEIRYTQSGKAVTKFTLAVNNPRNKEETTFVDIVAWDRLGETCNTYLKKGSSTLVEGRLVIRSYDDKDGNKRKATEVVIDNMQMLSTRGAGGEGGSEFSGGSGAAYAGARTGAANGASAGDAFGDELDDEIPF